MPCCKEGDIVLIEGDHEALDRMVAQAKLSVTGSRDAAGGQGGSTAIEAVIGENSSLIGWSAQRLPLYDRFNVNLLAVSRKGERFTERLGAVTLRLGDIIVLQGNPQTLPDVLRELGALPLAERPILLGSVRRGIVPVLILLAAMGATALGMLPVPVAFFAAAVADGAASGSFPCAKSTRPSTDRSWSCWPRSSRSAIRCAAPAPPT